MASDTEVLTDAPPAGRTFSRARRGLAILVAAALAWAGLAFLNGTVRTNIQVTTLPGASSTGEIADVTDMGGTITRPSGKAETQAGINFARIDIAESYQDNWRLSIAWMNESQFKNQTQIGKWALLVAVHYPVKNVACDGTDPDTAVTITDGSTYCAYRNTTAGGPSVVQSSGDLQGGQFLASDRLVGTVLPSLSVPETLCTGTAVPSGCDASGSDTDDKVRVYVVGTLMNPAGKGPPGQQSTIDGVALHLRVSKLR